MAAHAERKIREQHLGVFVLERGEHEFVDALGDDHAGHVIDLISAGIVGELVPGPGGDVLGQAEPGRLLSNGHRDFCLPLNKIHSDIYEIRSAVICCDWGPVELRYCMALSLLSSLAL